MHDTIRNQFEQDGYVVLEDFLRPAECDELVDVGREFAKQAVDANPKPIFTTVDPDQIQLKDKYFMESNDKISYFFEADAVGPNGELKVDPSISLNKVGHALHLLHPIFRCYTYSDRVKRVCQELGLNEPAVVQSMYIYKNPEVGGEVIPHQDSTYLYTEPLPPVGFWIALQDASILNGCLCIARGSHKSGVHRRLIRNPDKNSKQALIYDKPAPVYPESSFTPVPVRKGYARACEPNQTQNGCKIYGTGCTCGFGCKTEFIYRTRRACLSALRERSSNICYRQPCVRGICIQTVQEPGYACKCEGTGYYGQRCEKACPTVPVRGLVFPHECVVI